MILLYSLKQFKVIIYFHFLYNFFSKGFVQHDQIKSEIINQNALVLLTNSCQYLSGDSERLLLESLGSISFDKEAAQLLRENTQFINSVEDIQKTTDQGMQKAAENIIWNIIKGI